LGGTKDVQLAAKMPQVSPEVNSAKSLEKTSLTKKMKIVVVVVVTVVAAAAVAAMC